MLSRGCRTLWSLALIALQAGCVKEAADPSCVNVGSGWRACSADMPASMSGATGTSPGSASGRSGSGESAGRPTSPPANAGVISSVAPRAGAGSEATAAAGTAGQERGAGAASGDAEAGRAEPQSLAGAGSGGVAAIGGMVARAGATASSAGSAGHPAAGSGGTDLPSQAGASGQNSLPNTCCHALGLCVPDGDLSSDQRALLQRDSCQSERELCAPVALLDKQPFVPKTCHSVLNAEGRCLPDCMSTLAHQGERLPRDVCDTHELCAPCFDPITGNATGSCSLGADTGPRESPQLFASCCGAGKDPAALCVPQSYVPAGKTLPQASCPADLRCLPRSQVLDPSAKLPSCMTDVRGTGVCLAQCIADAVGIVTVQASCAANEVCFPCTLVDGTSTNACPSP